MSIPSARSGWVKSTPPSITPTLTPSPVASAQGVNVVSVGTADRMNYANTLIMDYTGKPYTARWLAQAFNVPEASIVSGSDPGDGVDIQVILGQDWSVPATQGAP